MKTIYKCFIVFLVLFLIAGSCLWAQSGDKVFVDTYSSASETKTMLRGAELDAVAGILQAGSSDLASAAKAKFHWHLKDPGIKQFYMKPGTPRHNYNLHP